MKACPNRDVRSLCASHVWMFQEIVSPRWKVTAARRKTLKTQFAVIYGLAAHNWCKPNLNWIHFLPWRELRKSTTPPPPPRKMVFSVAGAEPLQDVIL